MDDRIGIMRVDRVLAWIGGALVGLWTSLPTAMHVLIIIMAADVLTGMCRAGAQGRLNSHCSFKGMMKKAAMLIVCGLGILLDERITPSPGFGHVLPMAFSATEGLSILENLRALGIKPPKPFEDWFINAAKGTLNNDEVSNAEQE